MPKLFCIFFLILLLPGGCARNNDGTWKAPLVYRVDIQQGNVIDQEMIDRLKPGMDKKQVKFIMGTPLIIDPFHNNRWDYVYSFEPGRGEREQRRISLIFKEDKLAYIQGDIKVSDRIRTEDEIFLKENTVVVPLEDEKPGFFSRMFKWDKKDKTDEEEITGMDEAAESEEPSPVTEKTGTTEGETPVAEATDETEMPRQDTGTAESSAVTTSANKTAVNQESSAGDTQEKNLLRRFWDRMTKSTIEDVEDEEESEQERRDAEVLEGAGGNL
jgi:Small protein A (tmRNA-binding)